MTTGTEIDVRGICRAAAVVLGGAGAILVLAILVGSSRQLESKSFSFALVFALFTLPAATGVYLALRRPGLALLGALTTIAAMAAFVATIAAIWHGNLLDGGGDWKTAAVLTLVSIGSGQGSLILALGRPDDSPRVAGLRWVALVPIAALTILGAEDVSRHGAAASAKAYSVFGVLYILGVVLPPLVARATRIEDLPAPPEPH
jgi:hypothetical protein